MAHLAQVMQASISMPLAAVSLILGALGVIWIKNRRTPRSSKENSYFD